MTMTKTRRNLSNKYEKMAKKIKSLLWSSNFLAALTSPIIVEMIAISLLPKFKFPQIELYNGTTDIVKHMKRFKAHITLHGCPNRITCRVFPYTKGAMRGWFGTLHPSYISNFICS